MERSQTNTGLTRRIIASSKRAVVLRGGAGAGKTAAVLALYERFIDETGHPHCLLLAPNFPAEAYLRRRLLQDAPSGVLVSPAVMTFAALAGRILASGGSHAGRIPAFRRHLLLGRAVDELLAEGRLGAFERIADTPGLVRALDKSIAELKRAAVEPDTLARAIDSGKGKPFDNAQGKHRDLLEVYRRYQQYLLDANAFDVEGQMWLARDRLAQATSAGEVGLEGFRVAAAVGFTDFTPTQLKILAGLSELLGRGVPNAVHGVGGPRVVITLPFAEDGRDRLWHWTGRTLDAVRRAFADPASPQGSAMTSGLKEIELSGPDDGKLAEAHQRVFDMDAPVGELPKGISIIAAAGIDAEVSAVARRVKRLLLSGAPAGSIAVVARSMELYGETVRRVFAGHEIPTGARPRSPADEPVVRFALDAASIAPRFAFRDVLRVIKNSYFHPRALGTFDEATVAAAETLIRDQNVLEGREAYARAASALSRRLQRQDDSDEDDEWAVAATQVSPKALASAAEMLNRLFEVAESTVAPADKDQADQGPRVAIRGLSALVEALQLRRVAARQHDGATVARDLRALAALEAVVAILGDEPLAAHHFREVLSAATCPVERGEALVDVIDVLDARALEYDHVFVLGVTEGVFPARLGEGSLLGEAQRSRWFARGVELASRSDLTAREMLLFYLAVSRAGKSLTLSYLLADNEGRPGAPSSFLLSLLEPFGGLEAARASGAVETIPPGSFLSPSESPATRREAFTAAISGALEAGAGEADEALWWVSTHAADRLGRASNGLWAFHRRWLAGECDEFDGRLSDPALLERMRRRFDERAVFSATQLGTYGQCPWRSFAARVLKLEALAEPQRRLEPVARGIFCHRVLFRVMSALREARGGAFRLSDVEPDRLAEALDRAVAVEGAVIESARPAYPAFWRAQRDQMRRALFDYLLCSRAEWKGKALHFELAFGRGDLPASSTDPASVGEPVTLETPSGPLRLSGKIDRVDSVELGSGTEGVSPEGMQEANDTGGTPMLRGRLFVIDYKTGALPARRDITEGRSVQTVVYGAAARELLGGEAAGGAFHRIGGDGKQLLFAAFRKSRKDNIDYERDEDYEADRDAAIERMGEFVRAMRAGRFDALPTHDCPKWCEFRQICHYSDFRAERKSSQPEDAT